jgi:hypothetical protein
MVIRRMRGYALQQGSHSLQVHDQATVFYCRGIGAHDTSRLTPPPLLRLGFFWSLVVFQVNSVV